MKRWGILSTRSDLEDCWVAQCKFLSGYTGTGISMDDSITSLLRELPKRDAWREVASTMLGKALRGCSNIIEESPFDSPDKLWTNVVDTVFLPSYGNFQNEELINSVYAFSEWCLSIDELAECRVAGSFRSAVHVILYEAIPTSPPALNDLPNWFCFNEIQESFLTNPFMSDYFDVLTAVFSR